MAKVHILNVTVHNNPAPFFTPFQFEIHFECLEELQDGLKQKNCAFLKYFSYFFNSNYFSRFGI